MEKDGACKMYMQKKKCSCARKSGRRKNAGTDKEEEKKLTGPLAKKELPAEGCSRTGVFNLLSSRANLNLSYNPAGRSHCRLQNHCGYIKHHHRGMGSTPGDVDEVPITYVKQRNGCRTSCDVGEAAEGLENEM